MREFLFALKQRRKQGRPMRPKERRKFLKQLNRKMRGEEKKVGKKKERRENLYLVSSDDESLQKIIKLQDINSPVKAFCNWLET